MRIWLCLLQMRGEWCPGCLVFAKKVHARGLACSQLTDRLRLRKTVAIAIFQHNLVTADVCVCSWQAERQAEGIWNAIAIESITCPSVFGLAVNFLSYLLYVCALLIAEAPLLDNVKSNRCLRNAALHSCLVVKLTPSSRGAASKRSWRRLQAVVYGCKIQCWAAHIAVSFQTPFRYLN